MLAEFPSIAELMALAVSAGESAIGAMDRVCRSPRGELSTNSAASSRRPGPGSPSWKRCGISQQGRNCDPCSVSSTA